MCPHREPCTTMLLYLLCLFFGVLIIKMRPHYILIFFFLNDTAPPEISTLPLHDALPIFPLDAPRPGIPGGDATRPIQHEDRDVLDVLDQLSEGLRGFAGDGNGGHYALRQHDEIGRAHV